MVTPVGSTLQLPAILIKPDGEGPFPAVVIAHDCSGLGPRSSGAPRRWAGELVQQGYVVLIPDSFTPRGFADGVCLIPGNETVSANGFARAGDAYAALTTLRKLPYVDGKRVGIMGGSHGGWTTLAAMFVPLDAGNPLAEAKRDGFAAAIALYPSCAPRYGAWSTSKSGNCWPCDRLFRRVSTDCAAADTERREGRLDTGGAMPPTRRTQSCGRLSGRDQDLSGRASCFRQQCSGALRRAAQQQQFVFRPRRDDGRQSGGVGGCQKRSRSVFRAALEAIACKSSTIQPG